MDVRDLKGRFVAGHGQPYRDRISATQKGRAHTVAQHAAHLARAARNWDRPEVRRPDRLAKAMASWKARTL